MARHLERYPSGDYNLQHLVATLCSLVAGFGGQKISPYDFAPWLRSPEERSKIKKAKQLQKKSQRRAIIGSLPALKRGKRA